MDEPGGVPSQSSPIERNDTTGRGECGWQIVRREQGEPGGQGAGRETMGGVG